MQAADLIEFEAEVARKMKAGEIHTPTHLGGGNEGYLIDIFRQIGKEDWVFASYRNHYHALLKGIPADEVMKQIVHGRSMTPCYPGHRFFTSAIVGAGLPVAVGVAAGIKRRHGREQVWCFVGDMAATTGAFHEAATYASRQELPIMFVIEDNGLACDTPTAEVWGKGAAINVMRYHYERTQPHLGGAQ